MKSCRKRWMEIQKGKCRDEEIRKREQEKLFREVTGNQLGTEYARQEKSQGTSLELSMQDKEKRFPEGRRG